MINKKAQFFLIAALIIAGVIIGLAGIYNYTTSIKEDTQIYDLTDEIGYESNKVIDHGVYNSKDTEGLVRNFTSLYSDYITDGTLAVVYGDSEGVDLIVYEEETTGSIGIGSNTGLNLSRKIIGRIPIKPQGNKVKIELGNESYDFELTQGQNFFVVIKREKGGEKFVSRK